MKFSEDFQRFWTTYPRRVGKLAAFKAWAKALKYTKPETILKAVADQGALWVKERKELCFIPHPATWLNQGRWEDELPTAERPTATQERVQEQQRRLVKRYVPEQEAWDPEWAKKVKDRAFGIGEDEEFK